MIRFLIIFLQSLWDFVFGSPASIECNVSPSEFPDKFSDVNARSYKQMMYMRTKKRKKVKIGKLESCLNVIGDVNCTEAFHWEVK